MENAKNSGLFGGNVFTQAFREFDEESFFESLHGQVRNKSYFDKYKGFKITITILSYIFNLGSALTASYAVYWLTQWLTGHAWLGYIIAGCCLYFLESIKRKSSTELWQTWFFRKELAVGWLVLSLACFGASICSSAFGVKQGTEEQAPDPELLKADSMAVHYNNEIAKLEAKNEDLRANKDKNGITFYKLADGIDANELIIADYRKRALGLEKKLDGKNEKLTSEYMTEVKMTAWTLVYITIIMELLFECCIAYIWYYYFRSYVERSKTQSNTIVNTKNIQSVPNEDTNNNNLQIVNLIQLVEDLQLENAALKELETEEKQEGNLAQIEQERTQEDTDKEMQIDDRYTVPHTYTRGGKSITVHYNATMVKSRIGEYERRVVAAKESDMEAHILENRKEWLAYWKAKQQELLEKRNRSSAA